MPLLVTRASALSHMERALNVPRQRPRTLGPGLRLISPVSKGARKSPNQAGTGMVAAFFCYHKGKEMELTPKTAKG